MFRQAPHYPGGRAECIPTARHRNNNAANQRLAEEARLLLGEGRGHELQGEHEVAAEWSDGFRRYRREYLQEAAKRCCAISLSHAKGILYICDATWEAVWVRGRAARRVNAHFEQSIGVPLRSGYLGKAKRHTHIGSTKAGRNYIVGSLHLNQL